MKTKVVIGLILAVLAAAGSAWHCRAVAEYNRADLAKGYRGLIMHMPAEQLSWVKKGDSIDVISVFEAVMKGGIKEKVAATILQNVKVAGVNQRKGTVVILLNPNETQYAALAKVQGEVSFALRKAGDSEMAMIEIASYRKLIK